MTDESIPATSGITSISSLPPREPSEGGDERTHRVGAEALQHTMPEGSVTETNRTIGNSLEGNVDASSVGETQASRLASVDRSPTPEQEPNATSEARHDVEPFPSRPVSPNGAVVVGHPSAMNKEPWWHNDRVSLSILGFDRDLEADLGRVGDLAVMALSLRGTKHQYYAGANEDSFCLAHTNEWLIITVADGVSAAKYSAYASKFFAHSVCRSLRRRLADTPEASDSVLNGFVSEALQSANDKVLHWNIDDVAAPDIDSESLDTDERYASLATTLSIALVPLHSAADGRRSVTLASVGDSPVYTLHRKSWALLTDATKEGEILDNSTPALPVRPGDDPCLVWRKVDLDPDAALAVMTDGIGTSLGRGQGDVGLWLAERLSKPCTMEEAVRAARFDRRGEDDDRTIVMVWGPLLIESDT